ncbi:hypothetical protein CKAN_01825900 [Cinnamomum micranthum f. kanehirae]|uniref:Uncharacterized protein n=1 Tax=Cinnamomum micranthum f. kanehirae TaxID=337451 RepID=A0A3S3QR79_9MAGN|nr:hypothetical protein CKAN_01825900 [Cinnamomum micranthum f. kanehirae]
MPRRPSRRIGGTSRPTGGDASTSSKPSRVRTKIGVARPPRRGVHASSSTGIRQRPTASERRRKMVQDPLPEPVDEDIESSSEDDSSGDEAGPSSPPQLASHTMEATGEDDGSDRAKDHIRATLARTDEPSDFYIWALQTTLKILDGLPVTYRRSS